ncbi:hypothetical protein E9531_08245 [Lampropedia puyangensis]|uniref:Transmembrane protein n=1 Tax=Lampropedia puyangensis TaxID=1330072 RepID=A0A4S8F3M5_9BURK|nr:hypothetical protein [Lampropedia puyangensis]THU01980.1 hypothetical protein E9531_08245 [Lampropedia puyangensis]
MNKRDHNDVVDVQAREQVDNRQNLNDLRLLGWISYGMHLVVAVCAVVPGLEPSLVLLLLALILDLVKRSDAQGTWQASHFDWRISSVGWAIFLYAVTAPLFLLFYVPGKIAWFFVSIWFLIRIVRGMVAMNKDQAIAA